MDIEELARKVSDLERKIDDLSYDLRRATEELDSKIAGKADRRHSHDEADIR